MKEQKQCEICQTFSRSCRESKSPLIQGRFQSDKDGEVIVFEKIKDCPVRKAYLARVKAVGFDKI